MRQQAKLHSPGAASQTRAFLTVALVELWERFGYYGMQALIVYFMVQRLGFDDTRATLVWGAAAALIYVAPAIGGWIGDQVLGTRRCMIIGAVVLALGYGLMAIPTTNTWLTFSALGVIVVGNGLFKPNTANLVRKIYEGDDARIDSAFTIYSRCRCSPCATSTSTSACSAATCSPGRRPSSRRSTRSGSWS